LSILARRVRLTCKISQDDVPDSADLEIFFEVFWRGCRIVSLLGYPEKTDRFGAAAAAGKILKPRFLFWKSRNHIP